MGGTQASVEVRVKVLNFPKHKKRLATAAEVDAFEKRLSRGATPVKEKSDSNYAVTVRCN